ncbi:TRAP transporter small permease [Bacillus canaveralius]|uniref:TRAP transporter small permease n=1 Tax=Bacillus canaveralius TaxID=1403243 RepID=UPI000F765FF9|nr:TRAP transporter small permease [Bacillus canaveralius]RSK57084.1 TRAP transporter small permease [Bacillus canaveralius]
MKIFSEINNLIYEIEKILVIVLLSTVLISLTSGVFFRYFFNNPLHWTEETSVFALAWVTFVGGSMTLKGKQSAAVSIIVEKFTGHAYNALVLICNLTVFLFCACMVFISIRWVASPFILFEKSIAMQMPMIVAYLSVPVGFSFMTIHSLEILLHDVVDGVKNVRSSGQNEVIRGRRKNMTKKVVG